MATIQLEDTPYGRATKEALDHLQAHNSTGTFGYEAMPSSDPVRNTTILGDLRRGGLVEEPEQGHFQLTQAGRDASAQIDGS